MSSVRLVILACSVLTACSTSQPEPHIAQHGIRLPVEYVSPDVAYSLRFHAQTKDSYYELLDRSTGVCRATADSAIVDADFFENRFRGVQNVVFAADGSGVVITENLSDGGPSSYYILIHRQTDGGFAVRYLRPPVIDSHKNEWGAYRMMYPYATALTADSVTFYYGNSKSHRMSLARVPYATTRPKII